MTLAESGIARGYGGIWNEIDYSEDYKAKKAAEPKKIYKYAAVWERDEEDKNLSREEFRKKYFIDGATLYKLVNPDGELFSWMGGKDPIKTA